MSLQEALQVESDVSRIISKQALAGVEFDMERAFIYLDYLDEWKDALYSKIRPHLQLEIIDKGVVNKPFLANGDWCASVYDWYWMDGVIPDIGAPFTRVQFCEPVLSKRAKLIEQLLRLGWKPEHYTPITEKGGGNNPQLTWEKEPCPSLLKIDSDVGKDIAMWYTVAHRRSQIQGFVNLVRDDGRISAEAFTIGTPTYRFRHKGLVNVPKSAPQVIFGKQMRSLFRAKKGYKMVGHDASGLELRTLAHYINDEAFTAELLDGDMHSKNQKDAGLPTRDDAKTFIYAFLYGAGNEKLGNIIGGSTSEGRTIRERYLARNPLLAELIEGVRTASRKGYVVGIDGRRIKMRRDKVTGRVLEHKALNLLNQGCGAIVMKYSMVLLDKWVTQRNLDATKVIDMHDEAQAEVHPDDVEEYGELACESIREAGRQLGLRCPLDAEYKVGNNWSETH